MLLVYLFLLFGPTHRIFLLCIFLYGHLYPSLNLYTLSQSQGHRLPSPPPPPPRLPSLSTPPRLPVLPAAARLPAARARPAAGRALVWCLRSCWCLGACAHPCFLRWPCSCARKESPTRHKCPGYTD